MSIFTKTINSLTAAFESVAFSDAQNNLVTSHTWNGDVNFGSLGNGFESLLLSLDQRMVLPEKSGNDQKVVLDSLTTMINNIFEKIVDAIKSNSDQERAKAYNLLFRYLFYVRSIRVPGKKARKLFHILFSQLYTVFPKTCCELLRLIPDFGYFGDLDQIMANMSVHPDIIQSAQQVYINYLSSDCVQIFGKPLTHVSHADAKQLNNQLKSMSVGQLNDFMKGKHVSLAAKWFKREGKNGSNYRQDILATVYFPNGGLSDLLVSQNKEEYNLGVRRKSYCNMVFRNIISALSQCLLVGEQMMCETNPTSRTWAHIPIQNAPAKFITKYRLALANEKVGKEMTEQEIDTGNRFPNSQDRVKCRENLKETLIKGKINGAIQDLNKLSKIIYNHCTHSKKVSPLERVIISTQWNDMVTKLKEDINTTIQEKQPLIDPRNVIPVIDTSGSMASAQVQDIAIGLGILASSLSNLPGCLISFSDEPQIFKLNATNDVFDNFSEIIHGPSGLNTNIDATYRKLLELMTTNNVQETDFALLILTDGQFDSLVVSDESNRFNETVLIDRMEKAFNEKGYNLPRTIFWNLNAFSQGFPATSITKGVQLVSGYSQTLMLQVFTGNYTYETLADGSVRVNVTPWETLSNALLHQGYDPVSMLIASVGEGCLRELHTNPDINTINTDIDTTNPDINTTNPDIDTTNTE